MWVFSKDAEEGLKSLHNNLKNISQGKGIQFGYMGLLKVAVACGVAGTSIYIGAWIIHFFIGW
jgi:hypothetical protein